MFVVPTGTNRAARRTAARNTAMPMMPMPSLPRSYMTSRNTAPVLASAASMTSVLAESYSAEEEHAPSPKGCGVRYC